MSALPLAVIMNLAAACAAPGVPVDRIVATAQAESGREPWAIHDNTTGRTAVLAAKEEATALATRLVAQGHRIDAGVMQVNSDNWARLGLTAETAFDPALNVCAGARVLAEAYAIERRVSCRYNTGSPTCANGYPERIDHAAAQLRTLAVFTGPAGFAVEGDPRVATPEPPPRKAAPMTATAEPADPLDLLHPAQAAPQAPPQPAEPEDAGEPVDLLHDSPKPKPNGDAK